MGMPLMYRGMGSVRQKAFLLCIFIFLLKLQSHSVRSSTVLFFTVASKIALDLHLELQIPYDNIKIGGF